MDSELAEEQAKQQSLETVLNGLYHQIRIAKLNASMKDLFLKFAQHQMAYVLSELPDNTEQRVRNVLMNTIDTLNRAIDEEVKTDGR